MKFIFIFFFLILERLCKFIMAEVVEGESRFDNFGKTKPNFIPTAKCNCFWENNREQTESFAEERICI